MKKLLLLIFTVFIGLACKDKNEPSAQKTKAELITQNGWSLDKITDKDGKILTNTDASFLMLLNFEFRSDNETRAYEKENKTIIGRGTWAFIDTETAIKVDIKILGDPINFKIVSLTSSKLVLQAPTGSFLTGVGEAINLEFSVAR